ncbi:Tim44/TimA family putative adaptor protein [Asticcacaulis sp. AC402]|uniref:Tim44/TimA family putative adaptor protein n=1 Tax=Asticcacaulis sp. AC402 TaxID=1282361 RepID=UPI0004CFA20D|nr:Tim44/TimA family putative adaptor protein [Asticcacaulis sp. AC402]
MVALIIFAIVAVVILFQLYNVLGRKVGFRAEDKPVTVKGDEFGDLTGKADKQVETSRMPNLDMLKTRDASFNELNFLEKARETYEQVVIAFHKGELESVKDKLSDAVYGVFAKALIDHVAPEETLSFVDQPKADIDHIDFKDEIAQIRVRFLSELVFEKVDAPVESAESAVPTTKIDSPKIHRRHKRTAEYWTFQKGVRVSNSPWLLTKVGAAKP